MSPRTARKVAIFILRFLGINALLALVFLFMPISWIEGIHDRLGLGEMPHSPIVGYLSRSLCLFYGLLGAFLIGISLDLDRYRPLVRMFGWLCPLIGIFLLGIDLHEKMPGWWIASEGPFTIVFGVFFLWLLRIVYREGSE